MPKQSPSFSELINSLSPLEDGGWAVTITDNWMQGRTTYGGLSAAICLQAVNNQYEGLPSLRSAQVSFIGPAGGTVAIQTKVLRRGKSVAYISAEMISEQGIATHAVFCFGASRESKLNAVFCETPDIVSPEQAMSFFGRSKSPAFVENFDCKLGNGASPISGSSESEFHLWTRHKDEQANNLTALISIADMPPPAVLPMFKEFAPISSMTWMINFLDDQPTTNDGWWLVKSSAEHAIDGYSSQDIAVWNSDKKLVITARQNIAIFY